MENSNIRELMYALEKAYQEEDAVETATLFWEIGQTYLDAGNDEKALVYINRFNDLVSSDDDLYEQFQEKDDKASQQIAQLQEKPSFRKEIQDWVNEKEGELTDLQKMQWNLLTLARMNQLFLKISGIPGFEVFEDFDGMIDMLAEGIYFGLDEEEEDEEILDDFLLDLDDAIEIPIMISSESRVKIKGDADFEALDLVGDSLYLNLTLALYGIVNTLEDDEEAEITLNFVPNALHMGYYARTRENAMDAIEALTEEKDRIMSDYEFIKTNPEHEEFVQHINTYKDLFLPKMYNVNETEYEAAKEVALEILAEYEIYTDEDFYKKGEEVGAEVYENLKAGVLEQFGIDEEDMDDILNDILGGM